MAEPITWTLVGKTVLFELARGVANGFAKGFTEAIAKELNKPQKSSSAIVQQTKEQAKWIQAQSEYLKGREEREKLALGRCQRRDVAASLFALWLRCFDHYSTSPIWQRHF